MFAIITSLLIVGVIKYLIARPKPISHMYRLPPITAIIKDHRTEVFQYLKVELKIVILYPFITQVRQA